MKNKINKLIDWFESHFNFIIDMFALAGGVFLILLGVFYFFGLILNANVLSIDLQIIFVPGVMGFLGILMLFALRITRHLTKNKE